MLSLVDHLIRAAAQVDVSLQLIRRRLKLSKKWDITALVERMIVCVEDHLAQRPSFDANRAIFLSTWNQYGGTVVGIEDGGVAW